MKKKNKKSGKDRKMQKIEARPKIIVIAGPTSSGKSALAVKMARKIGGEIISADSRQIYKNLNIGTGKITRAEMKGVPHHMIDIVSPGVKFSVQKFKKMAEKKIDDILARGKTPILVGGSGQYINAIVYNQNFPEVPPNRALRKKLEKMSVAKLQKILEKKDPTRFKNIDKNNPAQLVRAIEIATKLGAVPPLQFRPKKFEVEYLAIKISRADLIKKITKRFDARFNSGLIKEVKKLLRTKSLSYKRLHELGLEYRLAGDFLQGKISAEEMRQKMLRENIKYAKRQTTWFKRNKDIKWI